MRLRPRNRNCLIPSRRHRRWFSFLSLPEEVILVILKCFPANELLNLRRVCSRFKNLIDSSSSLWISATFPSIWPSPQNLPLMERAAKAGNIEALIKLGLAHLYNEGITLDANNNVNAVENGQLAADYFSRAERALLNGAPFAWFFVRPPWSPSGSCCKACVFSSMVDICSKAEVQGNKSVFYCVGKILSLHEDEKKKEESVKWLEKAAQLGSTHAAYELWKLQSAKRPSEPSHELQSLRELRDCASSGNTDAQLALALKYTSGFSGGITKEQVAEYITQFISRSKPQNSDKLFTFQTELNSTMRYILVDWLVEVAVMKDFSSQIVHIAVQIVDQYLMRGQVQRSELQLLGITSILIAARFQGRDIVTIREAAWLTDNTYKYEEVVRMMGEVMSCIKGQVRVLTIPDYLNLLCRLAAVDRKTECIASYIGDLCLLHTEFGRYSPAMIAAAIVCLANAILLQGCPWPVHMVQMTGLRVSNLYDCVQHLHQKCLVDDSPIDHRNVKLKAIRERYTDARFMKVSDLKVPSKEELRHYLLPFIIQSQMDSSTNCTASVRCPQNSQDNTILNVSNSSLNESGYDGDQEDEGETMCEDVMDDDDDELFAEFGFQGESMINKQFGDSSFLCMDDFARGSSTPSILQDSSKEMEDGFQEDPLPMDFEHGLVMIDNQINSINGYFVPVPVAANDSSDAVADRWGGTTRRKSRTRQPLKSLENNVVNASLPWKPYNKKADLSWRTRRSRNTLS